MSVLLVLSGSDSPFDDLGYAMFPLVVNLSSYFKLLYTSIFFSRKEEVIFLFLSFSFFTTSAAPSLNTFI